MHGMFGGRRSAALYLAAWLMLAVVLAGMLAGATGADWGPALLFAVPVTLVYAWGAGFSAYYLCRAYPLGTKGALSILAVMGFAAMCAAALWTIAAAAWNGVWSALAPGWAGIAFAAPLRATMFGLGVILYGVSAVANYLAIEFDRARLAETRELEMKLLAQDAELRMLRTQVDPHFLFNSLNSISALTSIDPGAARRMTVQLADFFRLSLGLEAHRKVTLAAELELARHFLAIEQVRFGARLGFEEDIGLDAAGCLLPPMLLQPLVENAVKHGIGNLLEGGTVRVAATRAGSILRISVENDADCAALPTRYGIGLANVRQRLVAAYAHQASANWTCGAGKFRVELALPAETETAVHTVEA
jgi:two-component system sensor histidine kinase AlgZ